MLKRIVPKRKPHGKRDAKMRAGSVELIKRGASRYDFHDPNHIALSMSWKGFALAFVGLELCHQYRLCAPLSSKARLHRQRPSGRFF